MINKDLLEDTQEILINIIESFKEMTSDNMNERLNFVKKALNHLNNNVIKDKAIETYCDENKLLRKIKRNLTAISYSITAFTTTVTIEKKRDMVTSWLTYYVKQIDALLGNGY
jgi:hypothetical protein